MTPDGQRTAAEPVQPEIIADRYKVERELGHGGMATVYLCTDTKSGTQVAVKVLKPELGGAVSVERFLREITFSSQLDHPQIPKVLGSGVVGQLPFYVMTYIEGESLRSRLDRLKQLPIDEAIRITRQAIVPTAYAHSMGIIHRDIKPANILITKERVYVLDFGVARALAASADESLTSTGVAVGTPAYMSPEQALAQDNLDERSDVYSLACVTYEMIAGIPPFVGATAQAVLSRRFIAPPPPLHESREEVPEPVETAIAKALRRAPADRWHTIEEFGEALAAPPPPPGTGQFSSANIQAIELASSRRKKIAIAIAAVAIVAAGITGIVAMSLVDRDPVSKARRALDNWNVSGAEAQLRKTIQSEGDKAPTQLWLAQAMILRGAPVDAWRSYALHAAQRKNELTGLDTLRALALADYADKSNGKCDRLRALQSINDPQHPADYTAAVTLGDCLKSDGNVVEDGSMRTGYRFASSYQEVVSIYEKQLQMNSNDAGAYRLLVPRLASLLWTGKNQLRSGVMKGEVDTKFVSYPTLNSDTIAFEPVKLGGTGVIEADPERLQRFITRNTEKLRALTTSWVRVAPRDPDAQEALGNVLEIVGVLEGSGASAVSSIQAARLAASPDGESAGNAFYRRLRLANTHTRLLLKLGQYRAARLLADSATSWNSPAELDDSVEFVVDNLNLGLLAMTGQLRRAVKIQEKYAGDFPIRLPSGEVRNLPGEIGADASRLATYAAFGCPADSIIAIEARIRRNLESAVASSDVDVFQAAVLRPILRYSVDVIGTHPLATLGPSSDPFINAVRAVDEGKLSEARKLSDQLGQIHSGAAAGEITMDVVLQEAWLRTAIGDTNGAARSLDRALRGLPRAPSNLLNRVEFASSLVRAMLLRASLAPTGEDAASADVWRSAARELWSNGDPEVKAVLAANSGN